MPDANADPTASLIGLPNRGVLRIAGPDRVGFLQGLISNDVKSVRPGHAIYACLLTPQGKFLHDFFLIADGESLLLDCEAERRLDLMGKLKMYRLRSKVEITDETEAFAVFAALGPGHASSDGQRYPDPRRSALGDRILLPANQPAGLVPERFETYDRLRIAEAVPDGSRDMEVGKAILLENNIDLLNGISWDKGCYTGQELTARTRYRGLIKKRLVPVAISGPTPTIGTPLIEKGAEIGEMRSSCGNIGLALLRLEVVRQARPIELADAVLTPQVPAYLVPAIDQPQA